MLKGGEEMIDEENMKIMLETIELERNMFWLSYCGPNCRHCNRHPSYIRKFYWKLEDLFWKIKKWYYKDYTVPYTIEDYFND
jgi:hypothetical protein